MSTWNKKNFSIYTSDERSALGLIEELGKQTNDNTEEIEKVKESDNKKVSHDEMNSIYKIDKNADFTGSWFGIKKPTASNEGLASTVDKINEEDIPSIKKQLKGITTSNLSLKRQGRKFFKVEEGIYHNAQAMCYLGNDIILQSYQLYHGNKLKLEKMNINTGEVISSNVIDGFHGNGMCYNSNDGYVYITPAHNYGASVTFKSIIKVDKETLTIVDTIDLSNKTSLSYIHSIGYDEIKDRYVVNNKNSFEVYDKQWNLIKSFTCEYEYKENRFQTITVKNGNIYQILSAPETIVIIDLEEEEIISIINVDKWHEKIFSLGEIEGIYVLNDNEDILITSITNLTNNVGGNLVQFWKGNLKINNVNSNIQMNFQNAQEVSEIWLGENSSFNPNGSKSNPFNITTEASITLCSPFLSHKSLNFSSSFDDTLVFTENCSNLVVNTNGNSVKALICLFADNIYFHEIKTTGYSGYNNNAIYLYMSNVVINGVTPEGIDSNFTYYAHIERSTVTLPQTLLNRNDIKVLVKNSKCYANQHLLARNTYKAVNKENSNAKFFNLKWCNGKLSDNAILPSDYSYYTKARIIYRFNNLSEFTKEINFNSVDYSIRIDGIHQTDSGEIRVFTCYLKYENGKYIKGNATGFSYIGGQMAIIPNESIDVKFDIAFYD